MTEETGATEGTGLPVSGPAVVAYTAGDLRVQDVPLATPGPDEAVVELHYDVITALADGTLHLEPVTTREYPLSQGLEAFATARKSAESGKVLLNFKPVQGLCGRSRSVSAYRNKHPGLIGPRFGEPGRGAAHDLFGGFPGCR
ncbi:hypothetical protein ABIB45_000359 [Arthrobacter sp. UYCo732]